MYYKHKIIVFFALVFLLLNITSCSLFSNNNSVGTQSDKSGTSQKGSNLGYSSNSLSAVDKLGRVVSPIKSTKTDRFVGIFYMLWFGQHPDRQTGIYDISKLSKTNPSSLWALWDETGKAESPVNQYHYWGEPLFGYYNSEDEWVMRKHIQMLTNAGVDFLVFDVTNLYTYNNVWNKLLPLLQKYHDEGWKVPKIVFYTNTDSGNTITSLYKNLYKPGKYKDLWFMYKNKPLIIGKAIEVSKEIKGFFYFKSSQWPSGRKFIDGFPWIDFKRPQQLYGNVMSVSVSQHPNLPFSDSVQFPSQIINYGRGYHNGSNDTNAVEMGANFQEQWDQAIAMDPEIVHVTGWNEWAAVKFVGNPGGNLGERVYFSDTVNEEYSRDVEPMKGGYEDNFYLQLIQNIRRYKGIQGVSSKLVNKTIDITKDVSQWNDVTNVFRDFSGDEYARNSVGFCPSVTYKDNSVRNDIQEVRVTNDDDNVYFLITTKNKITSPTAAQNWLNILIDTTNSSNSFAGYEYVINRNVSLASSSTSIEQSTGGYNFRNVGKATYNLTENTLQVKISRTSIGLGTRKDVSFSFKVSDNVQKPAEIMDYYVTGDSVPLGRLNFTYR